MILFVNACVREESRTRRIAEHLLQKLNDDIKEVDLHKLDFPRVEEDFINWRNDASVQSNFLDETFDLAKDFAQADKIVIAAPYWDLSFPASLKQYIEQINVLGITFAYTEDGQPKGLCKAKKLYYVTTAGGPIYSDAYGFGYVKALAQTFYGIQDVAQIKAEGLDLIGADVEGILAKAFADCDQLD